MKTIYCNDVLKHTYSSAYKPSICSNINRWTTGCWYQSRPMGHNTWGKTVQRLYGSTKIVMEGFTNYSLCKQFVTWHFFDCYWSKKCWWCKGIYTYFRWIMSGAHEHWKVTRRSVKLPLYCILTIVKTWLWIIPYIENTLK